MRLEKITTFDATTAGSVESEIQYQYNDFGQITKEFQQHGAAVNLVSSPAVEYDQADGGANSIRMTSMTYPDGRQLDYGYGTSGSESDLLDRVVTIKDDANTLVTYNHSGSGSLVTQTYNEPGIEKNIALGSGSDPYSALDRFGRMIDLRWTKSSTDLVHYQYDYDRAGNRLFERNKILGAADANPAIDNLFSFDELNRMTNFESGQLNTSGDSIVSPELEQTLTLDETGNIKGFVVRDSGTTTLSQLRVHNDVNEITNITEAVGSAWATPAHDTAGNMTSIPKPSDLTASFDATWDAWHRLVKLEDGASKVATYQYDGNGRRIIKGVYSSGTLSETRHTYYSMQSQALEERSDASTDAEIQFIWNLGYVDDLALRDRDTTANGTLDERLYSLADLRYCVTALADDTGSIVERFTYDAHGKALVLSSMFAARSSSNYDWEFRYTGRREDLETGLMFFRSRYYSTDLGRFVSRDPLGFVDGMSLFKAYFVPNGLDFLGLACCKDDDIEACKQRCAIAQGLCHVAATAFGTNAAAHCAHLGVPQLITACLVASQLEHIALHLACSLVFRACNKKCEDPNFCPKTGLPIQKPKPERPTYTPEEQIEHSCSFYCSVNAKSKEEYKDCYGKCLDHAWENGSNPVLDPDWEW